MNIDDELIRRLNFENFIWLVFIIVSAIDIYGDELIKRSVRDNDKEKQKKAENIFLFVALISIIVYVYFFYRNYIDYKKLPSKCYLVRLVGSSLVLIGTLCLVYFQLYKDSSNNIELASKV